MLGMLGTVILALGVTVISIVFIFGFKPTEFISDFLYDRQEKKNERKEERAVAIREQRKQEERRPVKSNKIYKKVYLYLVDINKLSDIKLEDEVVPKDQLQKEEISWAGFLTKKELKGKIFHRFSTLLDLI